MYPISEPYRSGRLAVSDLHQIYWEESGNSQGLPVIFLHGGPGAGASPKARGFFNPAAYRVVIIDQRGCGRSLPYAETRDNTTWDLVADIEKLRVFLNIERWQVFGGSWGSTLALAYAQSHPKRVTELVLRGIFLSRRHEIDWIVQGGANRIFPEYWADFLAPLKPEDHSDTVAAYRRLLSPDQPDRTHMLAAASAWAQWEAHLVYLIHNTEAVAHYHDGEAALAIARIENHYFSHLSWLEGGRALLANIDAIRPIPTVIVQGRYDICTPPQAAWDLYQAFPEAQLQMVLGGHSAFDPEIARALVAATDRFAH